MKHIFSLHCWRESPHVMCDSSEAHLIKTQLDWAESDFCSIRRVGGTLTSHMISSWFVETSHERSNLCAQSHCHTGIQTLKFLWAGIVYCMWSQSAWEFFHIISLYGIFSFCKEWSEVAIKITVMFMSLAKSLSTLSLWTDLLWSSL